MALARKSAYIYDNVTGRVKYTIDNPTAKQVSFFRSQKIPFRVDLQGKPIVGTYVSQNTITNHTIGIESIRTLNVEISNTYLVANGTDAVFVSNITPGATVTVPKDSFEFVATEDDNVLEFTANGISLDPSENYIQFTLSEYGHFDETRTIHFISDLDE